MYSGAFPSFLHVSSPELVQSAYQGLVGALVVGEDEGASDGDVVGGGVGGSVGDAVGDGVGQMPLKSKFAL
jgi:hypothetical protein